MVVEWLGRGKGWEKEREKEIRATMANNVMVEEELRKSRGLGRRRSIRSSVLLASVLNPLLPLLALLVVIDAVVEDVLLVDEEANNDSCVFIERLSFNLRRKGTVVISGQRRPWHRTAAAKKAALQVLNGEEGIDANFGRLGASHLGSMLR